MVVQREMLLRTEKNKLNPVSRVTQITERIKRELGAFPFTENKIFGYIRRNYNEIRLIIPGNKGEQKNVDILNQLYQWNIEIDQQKRNSLMSTTAQLPMQLQQSH